MNTNIDKIYNKITAEIETILYEAADTLNLEIEPIIL